MFVSSVGADKSTVATLNSDGPGTFSPTVKMACAPTYTKHCCEGFTTLRSKKTLFGNARLAIHPLRCSSERPPKIYPSNFIPLGGGFSREYFDAISDVAKKTDEFSDAARLARRSTSASFSSFSFESFSFSCVSFSSFSFHVEMKLFRLSPSFDACWLPCVL